MNFIEGKPPRDLKAKDLARAEIGKRYWGCYLGNIPEGAAYRQSLQGFVSSLAENLQNGKGFLFFGDYRSGKTGAAVILMKATIAFGGTALLLKADSLTDTVIGNKLFTEDTTLWNRACEVDLLVLDDLGQEHTKEFGSALIEKLIRKRYDEKRSLVVTTNLTYGGIGQKYPSVLKIMEATLTAVRMEGVDWLSLERSGKLKSFLHSSAEEERGSVDDD